MNPCDPCVWNEMIMENQLTSLCHADSVLMACPFSQKVTDQKKNLDKEHCQKDPFTAARGKVHDHLGVTLDFSNRGTIMLSQNDTIKKF